MAYPSRTDIVTAMRNPQVSFKANELIGGSIIQKGSRIIQYSGGYTTVFPFHTKDSKKVAVRCWIADIGDAKRRSQEISTYLTRIIHSQILNLKRSHAKVGHINFTVIFFVSCIYLMIFLKFR